MNDFEKEKTDIAWLKLKNRLRNEKLIVEEEQVYRAHVLMNRRKIFVGLSFAAMIIIAFTIYFSAFLNDMNSKHIAMVEEVNKQESSLVTTLSDGTIVYLAKSCKLEYPKEFVDKTRNVNLYGKAFFEVAKNKQKPFIINTPDVVIEVIGTSFSITYSNNVPFMLNVKSGKVKVTNRNTNQFIYVVKGECASLYLGKLKSYVSNKDPFDDFIKDFRFKDQNLRSIVEVLNNQSSKEKIQLRGNIDDRCLTVTFSGENIDQMAKLIGMALNLNVDKKNDIIFLSDRK